MPLRCEILILNSKKGRQPNIFLKVMTNIWLVRELHLLSLEGSRLIADVVFFYKMINNHICLTALILGFGSLGMLTGDMH